MLSEKKFEISRTPPPPPFSTAFRLALRHRPKFALKPTPTHSKSDKLKEEFVVGWFEGMDGKQKSHKRFFFSPIYRAEEEKEGEEEAEFLSHSSSRKPMKMPSIPQDCSSTKSWLYFSPLRVEF